MILLDNIVFASSLVGVIQAVCFFLCLLFFFTHICNESVNFFVECNFLV